MTDDDKVLASLLRDFAATERHVQQLARLASRNQSQLRAVEEAALRDAERMDALMSSAGVREAVERANAFRLSAVYREAVANLERASAWMNQLAVAAQPAAPPAAAERRVQAVQARAPAVVEPLRDSQEELARLRAELASRLTAEQENRRHGARATARRQRAARDAFVEKVDAELRKSDEVTLDAAVERVLKRRGGRRKSRAGKIVVVKWGTLTDDERKRTIKAGKERYRRGKRP